jgi:uroporphyrinogen-III synthase
MTEASLTNITVALAESRELDLMAQMLEREGARVVRCPLVTILDAPDPAPVVIWIKRLIAGDFQDIIFYTGEGVRRILHFATEAGLRDACLAALGRVRKITRGPKPGRALREVGLSPDVVAEAPTTAGLIATLASEDIKGRSIGLQIYGQEPNAEMVAFLERQGALVHMVAPYVYASEADDSRVEALIRDMVEGKVSALLFTSSPQIARITELAGKKGLDLQTAFTKTRVGAIGPIVAGELARHGIHADTMPEGSFSMKPLVRAVAKLFQA